MKITVEFEQNIIDALLENKRLRQKSNLFLRTVVDGFQPEKTTADEIEYIIKRFLKAKGYIKEVTGGDDSG